MLPKFLCKINNHHVTYLMGASINLHLSISCNTLIFSCNIKLFNYWPELEVVIGTPMHKIASIASSLIGYKIYKHTCTCYAWSSRLPLPIYWPNVKLPAPFTLVYSLLVIGYAVVKIISSNHQPSATSKQSDHYQRWVCQQEWRLPQMEYMHDNLSMLTLCLLFYALAMGYSVAI